MRIPCPDCGERGSEEFAYQGAAGLSRPTQDAPAQLWMDYVYLRENRAGIHSEYWQHQHGCREWLVVTRDTRTHEIFGAVLARDPAR